MKRRISFKVLRCISVISSTGRRPLPLRSISMTSVFLGLESLMTDIGR